MSQELKFHPLADLFPLMEGEEFDALVADIKANGLREKIDLYRGKIVDGRNRYRALQRLGIDPSAADSKYFRKAIYCHTVGGEIAPHEQDNDARVRAYIISKNIHRRHLTAEQRRDLLVKLVAAQPEKADRVIAREAKVDHKQVSRARRKAEAVGAIAPPEKHVGRDGKEYPARKKKPDETQLERDRKECIALNQKVLDAERERDRPEAQEALLDQAAKLVDMMTDETLQSFFDEHIEYRCRLYDDDVKPKDVAEGLFSELGLERARMVLRALDKRVNAVKQDCPACHGTGFIKLVVDGFADPIEQTCDCGPKAADWTAPPPPPQDHSWRVEVTTKDGKRWHNGVRFRTREEAEVYGNAHAVDDFRKQGDITAEVIRCDDQHAGEFSMTLPTKRRKRPRLNFMHGTCGLMGWDEIEGEKAAPIENAPPPDVGADNMRAQIAALDDPGPMPESLRR